MTPVAGCSAGTVSASPSSSPWFSLGAQLPGHAISSRRSMATTRPLSSLSVVLGLAIAFDLTCHLKAIFAHLDRQPLPLYCLEYHCRASPAKRSDISTRAVSASSDPTRVRRHRAGCDRAEPGGKRANGTLPQLQKTGPRGRRSAFPLECDSDRTGKLQFVLDEQDPHWRRVSEQRRRVGPCQVQPSSLRATSTVCRPCDRAIASSATLGRRSPFESAIVDAPYGLPPLISSRPICRCSL